MASVSAFGNVAIIPSLALFRGVTAAALSPVAFLQGTVTPNDGGQGFYQVNLIDKTTADNGTSVIVDGGGFRWELVTADTASQIVAALSAGGTLPALDPILGGVATVAAATTTNLATVTQAVVSVTGSGATITGLGTLDAGRLRWLRFVDVNTLTHNATSLILPGGANITTAAGDSAQFQSLGSGNWVCVSYQRASGLILGAALATAAQSRDVTDVTHALSPSNLMNAGVWRELFTLNADMNTTSDQPFTKVGTFTSYLLSSTRCYDASTSLTTAVGGVYTAAAKGGTPIVAASQVYNSNTGVGAGQSIALQSAVFGTRTETPILSLTTPQGGAATATYKIWGIPLS